MSLPPPASRAGDEAALDLWWAVPGVLAGMPMPFVHANRRAAMGGSIDAFRDDLPMLYRVGIRAVVCLLNIPGDAAVYASAGFDFLCLPMRDGDAPDLQQFGEFLSFVEAQRLLGHPVAVHCEAGIGRTGTLLAAYLAVGGMSPAAAVTRVRALRSGAVETARQLRFLSSVESRPQNPT